MKLETVLMPCRAFFDSDRIERHFGKLSTGLNALSGFF